MHPFVYYSLLELNNTELQGAGRLLDVIALVCTSTVKSKTSTLKGCLQKNWKDVDFTTNINVNMSTFEN